MNEIREVEHPIYALNGKVACSLFPSNTVEKETRGGMVVPRQKGTMTKLSVVFTSGKVGEYSVGTSVWVRAETFTLEWAKGIYELDGIKFILVPENEILLVQS